MTAAAARAVAITFPRERPKYQQIGWAEIGRASVRFVMPANVPGGKVYLLIEDRAAGTSPVADALAGEEADQLDGTGHKIGTIHGSTSGRLLIITIDPAPAQACMFRQQFFRHYERGETTPVRAFPGEAGVWGVPT